MPLLQLGRLLALLPVVAAYSTNRGKIPSGYNVPCRGVHAGDDTTQGPVAGCYAADGQTPTFDAVCAGVGHTQCAGGGDRNVFGEDFLLGPDGQRGTGDGEAQWTQWLCEQDSDGDGWTNGEELGDPCCTWTEGSEDMPDWGPNALSHPGFSTATPLEPLTYDCSTTPPTVYAAGDGGGDGADGVDEAAVRASIFADGEEQLTLQWSADGVTLPEDTETIYMKDRVSFPVEFGASFYLVGIQVHVDSPYLHHLVVYQCPFEHDQSGAGLELEFGDMGCVETIFPWAPGPTVQSLPPDVGFWCGSDSPRCKSIVIDVHYDNPHLESGLTDSSGITFYVTPDREHAMGTLSTGSIADGNLLQVPPGRQDHFDATACIVHADVPVHVAGNFFHAHELGTGFWTDLYRDGAKIEEIGRDHVWSFDDQRFTPLTETLLVQSGDVLSTVCTFDATQDPPGVGRADVTYGGLGTRDEMCINFLWYWPAESEHGLYCDPCAHADGSLSEDGHTTDDSGGMYPGGLDALIESGQCARPEPCTPGEGDCMCTATELWSAMESAHAEEDVWSMLAAEFQACYSCLISAAHASDCFAPQCAAADCTCTATDVASMIAAESDTSVPVVSDECTSCIFTANDYQDYCFPEGSFDPPEPYRVGSFVVHMESKTFHNAEDTCVAGGGHLAAIHDYETLEAVGRAISNDVFPDFWIGHSDEDNEGEFAWTDGSPSIFDDYHGGEPNNYGGEEDCTTMSWDDESSHGWNDLTCGSEMPFICMDDSGGGVRCRFEELMTTVAAAMAGAIDTSMLLYAVHGL